MKNVIYHFKSGLKSTVVDDRGTTIKLCVPLKLKTELSKSEYAAFCNYKHKSVQRKRKRILHWIIRFAIIVAIIVNVLVLGLVDAWLRIQGWRSTRWWFYLGLIIVYFPIITVAFILQGSGARTRHIAAMIAINRCPVCIYKLNGIEPQSDQCTICPECGAAWILQCGDQVIG